MRQTVVKLGPGGSLVLPKVYCRALGFEDGDELLVRLVDGEVRLSTVRTAIERAQGIVRRYVPEGHSLTNELLAERRKEGKGNARRDR